MYVRLDYSSGEPIYRQIVEQVKYAFAAGRTTAGQQLPSIRALAAQLKINPRTVVKAYEELAHAGLVVMRQGQGVFFSDGPGATPASQRKKILAGLGRRLLAEASRLGADSSEVLEVMRSVAEEMESTDE